MAAIHTALHELAAEPCIDLIDDVEDLRQHAAEQIDVPLFERLGHNGMVRIIEGALRDLKRLLKAQPFLHQQPDQFRNADCGMRIVQLNGDRIRKALDRAVLPFIPEQNILQRCARKEVLLL